MSAGPARTDALDVLVELLAELDREPGSGDGGFYDRLCAALCRVARMERAILLLYDDARQLVVPVGSHGIDQTLLADVYGTLEETPIAQVALAEDCVVVANGELGSWVPERYARFGGVETLTCTPVSAGGRWLGVIFADRGGGWIDLAREIHERVVQRLFGVSLVLGSEGQLSDDARRRCADEMQAALKDLRDA